MSEPNFQLSKPTDWISLSFGKTISTFHLFRHNLPTHFHCDAPVLHNGEHTWQKSITIKTHVSLVEHSNSKLITHFSFVYFCSLFLFRLSSKCAIVLFIVLFVLCTANAQVFCFATCNKYLQFLQSHWNAMTNSSHTFPKLLTQQHTTHNWQTNELHAQKLKL